MTETVGITTVLDLHGEVCPYTFVKTKLRMEGMASGEVIKVLLDFPESARSVPRSATSEGHTVLSNEEVRPGEWELFIRKR